MAAAHQLTWFASRRRWKKKYRGKVYYCPLPNKGKADWDGYKAALAWWQSKQKQLDKVYIAQRRAQDMFLPPTERAQAMLLAQQRGDYETAVVGMAAPPTEAEWVEQRDAVETVRRQNRAVDTARTVGAFLDRFLDFKRSQAVAGQKSAGRFINIRTHLTTFRDFVGSDKPIESIDAVVVGDYYQRLINDVQAAKLSETTARDKMQVARQFVRYCWECGVIELPRNLDSKEMCIASEASEIETFDFDALGKMLTAAPENWNGFYPLRLYLLLMANCCFTQKDIADLKHSQVDYEAGTIRRKRSKRQKQFAERVPTVQYKLWPMTLELLRKYRDGKSDRVLTNRDGGVLRGTTLNADAATRKASNVDIVAKVYNEWVEQADDATRKAAKSLKFIRKTSASKLGEHPEYARYAQYALGQTAKTVADKHYVVPAQDRFDDALAWLGQQYGEQATGMKPTREVKPQKPNKPRQKPPVRR